VKLHRTGISSKNGEYRYNEEWWFNVVDVCAALTESADAGAYWRKLKQRLNNESNQPVTFCHGLKLQAQDGKMRVTDSANTEGILRIIQSIPSHWKYNQI